MRYFNSFTFKEEKEQFTPKKSGKSTLTADLSFNALLILIAPKLVFAVADAFFEPEVVKNSLSSFYHCFITVEGRSKNSLSLFFFWIVNSIGYYRLFFSFNVLHDFQSEQETKQIMLRLWILFFMPNCVRIFLCDDYYKHHRYMVSMKQVS